MEISKERRERWEQVTKNDAFNKWINPQIRDADGKFNVDKLRDLARNFGVTELYENGELNNGQIRMNIGNRLRAIVPEDIIDGN